MDLSVEDLRIKLKEAGLKITPQRIAILEAVYKLENHPTAENIIDFIRKNHPGVATGTVYNVLDTLLGEKLIKRVKTEKDAMRYEGVIEKHHHLYCAESDRIEDYFDEELDQLLKSHFEKKGITNFEIEDIILQIKGSFK
jgi:Fur family peroxide stress response transcriptional regulator